MSSHVIFFSGHNMCSLFILLELVCVPFNVFSFFFLERDIFSVLINCFWRTNKEHSQQHIPHWHGYIHVNWYSTILSLCTQRNGTPWELWPILVKYCRDKMLHADEEGRKQSWKKNENTKRIHTVTSKIWTALQNNGQWPCHWSGTFDDGDALWLFECVLCVYGFSLCICQSSISQCSFVFSYHWFWKLLRWFLRNRSWSHSTFIWWQATDRTCDMCYL